MFVLGGEGQLGPLAAFNLAGAVSLRAMCWRKLYCLPFVVFKTLKMHHLTRFLMSSGLSHFNPEDIDDLSSSFRKMGREFKSSQGSNHYGFSRNSGHDWDDDTDDLKEEDVWGGHDGNTDYTDWNYSYTESEVYENGSAAQNGKTRKSWLSMELQAAGVAGRKKEHVGVGFAAVEAVNGGWAPGFSSRKVKIPHMGGGAGGSGYANGRHDHDVGVKRGGAPQSAPVSMPVWPAKCGYGDSNGDLDGDDSCPKDGMEENEEDADNSDGDDYGGRRRRLPPHEIVDREYACSMTFSVIEGAGRTLKGIDQRKVRNAVWSCTGFED